ncbi:MAG: hypothetical protein OEZ65_10945, partial [Gemmatimonadota bacterium]|nr:hypothetical protein [Gemmatimonadota bacterium]
MSFAYGVGIELCQDSRLTEWFLEKLRDRDVFSDDALYGALLSIVTRLIERDALPVEMVRRMRADALDGSVPAEMRTKYLAVLQRGSAPEELEDLLFDVLLRSDGPPEWVGAATFVLCRERPDAFLERVASQLRRDPEFVNAGAVHVVIVGQLRLERVRADSRGSQQYLTE